MRNEERLVDQCCGDAAEDGANPIHSLSLEDAARHGRSERAGGIHRCARERSDRENVSGDGETNGETADLRCTRIDRRPEHDEYEKERGDELEHDRLQRRDLERDGLTAKARAGGDGLRE